MSNPWHPHALPSLLPISTDPTTFPKGGCVQHKKAGYKTGTHSRGDQIWFSESNAHGAFTLESPRSLGTQWDPTLLAAGNCASHIISLGNLNDSQQSKAAGAGVRRGSDSCLPPCPPQPCWGTPRFHRTVWTPVVLCSPLILQIGKWGHRESKGGVQSHTASLEES